MAGFLNRSTGAFDVTGYTVKCSGCGKPFQNQFLPRSGSKVYCRDCMNTRKHITDAEFELIQEELNLEQADAKVAIQLNELLLQLKSGNVTGNEVILSNLIARLVADENRHKEILSQLQKLQAQKPN